MKSKFCFICNSFQLKFFFIKNNLTYLYLMIKFYFSSGIYIKQEIFCPGTSKFDVSTGTCTNKNIICGLTAPTTIPPSATVSTTTSTTTASPVCTSSGRHLIPGTNCTRYDYCLLVFGVWQRGEYSCPGAGLFNPTTNICTLDPFICPF